MTRINLIDPSLLCRQHLIAEYRELPRIFALAHAASIRDLGKQLSWRRQQPANYTLGTGHMIFFYDKLTFLANRHQLLVDEMHKRGYNVSYVTSLVSEWTAKIPFSYWGNYTPTDKDIAINIQRIEQRKQEMIAKGILVN